MTKTPRLSKSGIEYLDYQWGIFSGCHNWKSGICQVENCWAKSFAQRFKNIYPNGFEPTFYPEAFNSPKYLKKPSIIGVGWVGDVIGYGLAFREQIFETIEQCPQHRFLFLTKNPNQLKKWEMFPNNCWVGATATNHDGFLRAIEGLRVINATVKFISFEPLLKEIPFRHQALYYAGISWLIIGLQTPYSPKTAPKIEWIENIVEAADKAEVKVFLKDNLWPLIETLPNRSHFAECVYKIGQKRGEEMWWYLRQEFPKETRK